MLHTIWEVKVACDGLDHSEALAFGLSGSLYAGGESGQIYKIDLETKSCEELARTGGFTLGLALDADENVYACDMKKHGIIRVEKDGTLTTVCDRVGGTAFSAPNFGLFDDRGDFYFTDSGDYWHSSGRLIRVHPDGTSESLLGSHLHFPNGLALSPGGDALYLIESTAAKIVVVPLQDDGAVGEVSTFVQLQGYVPDGMAFDKEGNLYVACYSPDAILKVGSNRDIDVLIEDKTGEVVNRPTNVAFRPGPATELYFTNLGGWHIGSLDVGVGGQPLRYPKFA